MTTRIITMTEQDRTELARGWMREWRECGCTECMASYERMIDAWSSVVEAPAQEPE